MIAPSAVRGFCTALLVAWLSGSASASDHGYNIWFAGRVIAVNAHQATIRIARGPTETDSAAVIDCAVARRALQRVRVGMQIYVQADTRRKPWHIMHLRPLELKERVHSSTFSMT